MAYENIIYDVNEGIATITFNRPKALNALNQALLAELSTALDEIAADENIRVLILTGAGEKSFVAGADIKFFLKAMDQGDLKRIVDFTRTGHELLLRIDKCEKPVVARLNGLALGGGAELALACDAIVADQNAVLGFPETGIGIYPGLGGTQRTVKRCGKAVDRYLVFTGDMVPANKAAELGLVDVVAEAGTTREAVKELLSSGRVEPGPGAGGLASPGPAKDKYEKMFSDDRVKAWLDRSIEPSDDEEAKLKKKISSKAPIALRIAAQLIDEGADKPIEEGVELELSHLEEIFATEDAKTGLSSVGRSRPEFKGK